MRKKHTAKPLPAITEAEWVVMRVLWEGAPMTANAVVAALAGQSEWKPKTVHTLLRRLADKGALAFEKSGREFVFTPQVEAGMRDWLADNPQGKWGKHAYNLQRFGQSEAKLAPLLENYRAHIEVESEGFSA